MNLLPQDIVVMLKLALSTNDNWTFNEVAYELKMSPSMVHSAVQRALNANLYLAHQRTPHSAALVEFLIHGVKYAFAPKRGSVTRGVPTGFASPVLKNKIKSGDSDVYVWPHPQGETKGVELEPLYKSVPEIALVDAKLYAVLGALDAIRIGRARERKIAATAIEKMLGNK